MISGNDFTQIVALMIIWRTLEILTIVFLDGYLNEGEDE